ncbi:MAG: DUF2652 domain-containing protein [Limisphaerales bacterium]
MDGRPCGDQPEAAGFLRLFREKITELSGSTTCDCHACTHIEKLRLKIIVHRGEALFHRVLHFDELAGVDVIIAHRLLKNSIKAGQYLLLTETAMQELQFPPAMVFQSASECYEDIGRIKTAFHDFDLATAKEKTGAARRSSAAARWWRVITPSPTSPPSPSPIIPRWIFRAAPSPAINPSPYPALALAAWRSHQQQL